MDNPLLWIGTVVIVILCIVMVVVAGRSFQGRERRMKEFYKKANRQKELFEKYKGKTAQELQNEPAADVIEGLAVAVQKKIEEEPSVNEAFLKLPKAQQYAYAAYYFFHDSEEKLSAFFRKNGEPLLSVAEECLTVAVDGRAKELIAREYEMLDDNNENVSVDEAKLKEWDDAFAETDKQELLVKVRDFLLTQDGLPV